MEAEEVGEAFRGWDHPEGGSPRWIHTDLEGNLAVTVDRVVTKTLSLGLEAWVRAVEVEVGTRPVEGDVMEGMGVSEGMTIVIATATTTGEATSVEGEVGITEEVGVVTVSVGEVAVEVVEAVAGDIDHELGRIRLVSRTLNLVEYIGAYRKTVDRDPRLAQLGTIAIGGQ